MFLKSLQLSGFKSFVDKTKISLEPGITAIVGPNGCGKSNICDSLRWVFGEQSAKLLRGGKMEELIFNGSDVKKAVGMAEVSVTLAGLEGAIKRPELSSYEEITVTRRLFRSGESAYLINKTNCRLKDIVEIFLDTGISTRSFSIMEQAQVNRLIVSKPLERRYIIEEAAGVIKYKHRRNEAMNKLESSRQNLVRIQDITKELATQMNSLKRQAAKARRFSAYRDEMHEHGVALLSSEYDRLKTLFGEMDKECVELEKDVTQNEVSVSEKQRGVEGFQNQISNSEKLLAEKRQLEYEARTRIEQAHESVSLMEGQQKTIEEEKTRKKRETGTLEDDLLSLSRKFENCGSETVEITEKLRERDKEYEEEKEALHSLSQELTELEGDSAAKERDVLDCISEISKKRNRLTEIETRLDGMGARATRLDQELDGTRAAAKQNEKSLGVESGLVLESKERLQKKKEEGKVAAERFRETTDEIKKVDLESAGLRETLSKKKGLLLSLEELKRKFEGFGEGVRAVMAHEEAGRLTGIRKLLVDVIRTAPEYERAIEAALGEKLSGVIVDDIESAVSAAEFLGNNKEGKGVFISLQGREEPPMPFNPGVDGFVGRASDLIENPDSGFQKVPFAVLGDVLVFTTAECALRFQKGNQGPWTTVTLDGIVVGPFGIVSGGQDGKTSASLLSKNREIRELREEVEKVQREIKELDNRKEGLSLSAKEFEECNKRVTFEIHELEVGCLNGEKELQRLNGDAERLKRKLETLNLEKEQLSEESGALFNESADAKAFLLSKETEQQDIGDALLKNREEVTQKRKDLDGLKEKMNASKVEIAELMAKRDFLASEKKRIAREKESGERRIERILKELGEGEEKIGVLKERISSKKEEIFELGKEREELEKDIDGSATETGEKRGDLRRLEEELRLVKGQLQEVQANLGEKKLKRSEIAMRVEHLEKRAREEYSIEPEALPAPVDGFDEAVSKSRLDYLRKELERYGDVNLTAISDFEKVEKRYAFLYAQEEDLVLSIRSLDETIKKIDRTTGKLFSETFEIINENFKKMFRRLFGGGKAELVLVEDESGKDPGIDILVQPPGKKLKNIQLMSAGEKAMTAISILFSVFMVRPSPFCLLDEIDAPLDDANIGRFKEMLRELTSETQFVIITHNQKTMTFADRLYGVTMQEHGVSNVLSVDMSEGKRKEANVAPMEVSGVREVETLSV